MSVPSSTPPPVHPLGVPWGQPGTTCGGCGWAQPDEDQPGTLRCAASGGRVVTGAWGGCCVHEPALDCFSCAACCGPAFDAVEVQPEDPVLGLHPSLMTEVFGRPQVRRTASNHCAALDRSDNHCRIYAERPQCCRDFTRASENCAFARRRVGRSPPWPEGISDRAGHPVD